MIAIETKYLGPTNFRGSRISATTANGHRMVRHYDYALNPEEAHKAVAQALADKMGWKGRLVGGGTKSGYCFVFVD